MDSDDMDPAETLLLRAKLHVRGGRRRISENKIPAGIASLHDAFLSAMQRFFLASNFSTKLMDIRPEIDLYDEDLLFSILKKSEIINSSFNDDDFKYLCSVLDDALDEKTDSFDKEFYLDKYDNIMKQLGILPFSENDLPPEDPLTY